MSCLRGGGVLLASSGWKPGMWLNTLQCTEHYSLLIQERIIWHKLAIMPRWRNHGVDLEDLLDEELGKNGSESV